MEEKIEDAIITEIKRQSAGSGLKVSVQADGVLHLEGDLDVVALATAITGSVAGGP